MAALAGCLSAAAADVWTTYPECRLLDNPANDGDSFHVKAGRAEYVFRLYFVDCPETDRLIPERVREQAQYFGTTEEEVLRCGEQAREFTRQFLAQGFTVQTRKQDARGLSAKKRYFALVRAGGRDLGEELVKRGLARAYGEGADLPDGRSERKVWSALNAAEKTARGMRFGAWRQSRAGMQPVESGFPPGKGRK